MRDLFCEVDLYNNYMFVAEIYWIISKPAEKKFN